MIEQRTPAWFDVRLGKATASRFADVLAKIKSGEAAARRNYRAQLVTERLTGVAADDYQNEAMLWGVMNEETARYAYTAETGNIVDQAGFEEHPKLEAGCSPDGYVDEDGLVEIKCPNTANHIQTLKEQKVPKNYIPQIQGQLWITGRKWCDFVSFDPRMPRNAQLFIKRVERDDEYIKELEEQVTGFLKEVDEDVDFVAKYKEVDR